MIAKLKRFDWVMLATMLALMALGTMAIRSAGLARAESVFHGVWVSNVVTATVGLVLYAVLAFSDYRKYLNLVAAPAYAAALAP